MTAAQIHDRRWAILGVLILSLFGITLDNTVLNVALPTLARDLHASSSQLQWLVDSYVLVFAGLLLIAGALSDRYGRRRALMAGLVVFGVGSAVSALVTTADQLILARAFMGLGAALTMPATLSIVTNVFEADERPKAIAAWAAVSAIGIVVGPVAGGWLLEHFHWTAIFIANVPFALIGLAATALMIPESRDPEATPLDPVGAVLSFLGLTTLLYGIIEEPARGWTDPAIVAALGAAVVLLGLFLAWERRAAHPMLDIRLFGDRNFSAASLSMTLVFFSLMGALFFLTQYLQGVLDLSPIETGIRFIPVAIGLLVASPIAAKATVRLGARVVVAAGLAVVAAGLALQASIDIHSGSEVIAIVLLIIGVGMGLAMTPATDSIMGALPKAKAGVGSAVNDTTREIGGALGVAILGSVFSSAYTDHIRAATAGLPDVAAGAARDSLGAALAVAGQLGGDAGATLAQAAREAFVSASSGASWLGFAAALAGAVVAYALLPARDASRAAAPATAETPAPAEAQVTLRHATPAAA